MEKTTPKQDPAYKVLRVKIKNFKNIDTLEMDLQGRSVFLIGENAMSKTSIMQAIWTALSNKGKPKAPIKTGETKAEILVVIGVDGREYEIEKIFEEGKLDKLEITSPDGIKTDKIANLEKLIGDINFDVLEFVNQTNSADGRRAQVKTIRGYLSKETNEIFDAINAEITLIEENRKRINSDMKTLKVQVSENEFSETDLEKYKDIVSIKDLITKQTEGELVNRNIETAKRNLVTEGDKIVAFENQIKELMKKQVEAETKRDAIKAELENAVPVPLDEIKKQIIDSGNHNDMVKKIAEHQLKEIALAKSLASYKGLDVKRKELDAQKSELIKNSSLPVEGLTFDENGLYFNGVPLDETQQSTSELMEIGIKLAMAKNPKCHIVKVARAESLGAKRLEAIMDLAKKNNYQMFFEEVCRGSEELRIQYVEEV